MGGKALVRERLSYDVFAIIKEEERVPMMKQEKPSNDLSQHV